MIPHYTKEDEEKFNRVLKGIQASIPPTLIKANLMQKKKTPEVEFVLRKALDEDIAPEKKEQIRHILDTGQFSQMVHKDDPKITKLIDQFVMREIKKAIKAGLLPPFHHIKYLPSMQKIQHEN